MQAIRFTTDGGTYHAIKPMFVLVGQMTAAERQGKFDEVTILQQRFLSSLTFLRLVAARN